MSLLEPVDVCPVPVEPAPAWGSWPWPAVEPKGRQHNIEETERGGSDVPVVEPVFAPVLEPVVDPACP